MDMSTCQNAGYTVLVTGALPTLNRNPQPCSFEFKYMNGITCAKYLYEHFIGFRLLRFRVRNLETKEKP